MQTICRIARYAMIHARVSYVAWICNVAIGPARDVALLVHKTRVRTQAKRIIQLQNSRYIYYQHGSFTNTRPMWRRVCHSVGWRIRARPQLDVDVPVQAEDLCSETYAASSLSRTFLSCSPTKQTLRSTLSQRPTMPGGSLGAVTVTLAAMLGCYKIFWLLVVKRTLDCKECRGFGITSCELCHASGCIKWIGKWDHVEPCPQCMGKRYHRCYSCGGLYHRPIFAHVKRNAGLNASQNQVFTTMDVVNPLVD